MCRVVGDREADAARLRPIKILDRARTLAV